MSMSDGAEISGFKSFRVVLKRRLNFEREFLKKTHVVTRLPNRSVCVVFFPKFMEGRKVKVKFEVLK